MLGPDHVIAGAGAGRVLRFDGKTWIEDDLRSKGLNTVPALFATSKQNVFAVADHAILRWDGAQWSPSSRDPSERFSAVHGSDADNVWIVGAVGTMLRGNGKQFDRVGGRGARARVSMAWIGKSDAFTVGGALIVRRNEHGAWTRQAETTTERILAALGGSSETDLWTFEFGGPALHWDGKAWSEAPAPSFIPARVRATAKDDVWAIGSELAHYDGKHWSLVQSDYQQTDLWSPARGTVYATARARDAKGVPVFTGGEHLLRYNGSTWTRLATLTEGAAGIGGLGKDVWIANGPNIEHWDGTKLTTAYKASPPAGYYGDQAVIVRGADDVTIAGHGKSLHFDGKSWTEEEVPLTNACFAGGPAGIFAFGPNGGVMRRAER